MYLDFIRRDNIQDPIYYSVSTITLGNRTHFCMNKRWISHKIHSPLTSVCLSVGDDLASTRSFGQILSIRSCSIYKYSWKLKCTQISFIIPKLAIWHMYQQFSRAWLTDQHHQQLEELVRNADFFSKASSLSFYQIPWVGGLAINVFKRLSGSLECILQVENHYFIYIYI